MVEFTYLEVEVAAGGDVSAAVRQPDGTRGALGGDTDGKDPISMLETLEGQGWEIVTDTRPAEPRQLLMRKQI